MYMNEVEKDEHWKRILYIAYGIVASSVYISIVDIMHNINILRFDMKWSHLKLNENIYFL